MRRPDTTVTAGANPAVTTSLDSSVAEHVLGKNVAQVRSLLLAPAFEAHKDECRFRKAEAVSSILTVGSRKVFRAPQGLAEEKYTNACFTTVSSVGRATAS